jgi:hydrogenase maturation factor HypF (carbamoyltransferase family)
LKTLPKAERFCSTFSKVEKKIKEVWVSGGVKKKLKSICRNVWKLSKNNNVDIKFERGFVANDGVSAFADGAIVR